MPSQTINVQFDSRRGSQSSTLQRDSQEAISSVPQQAPSVAPALLNAEQAAQYLGVSVRKLHELRAQTWFPPVVVLGPRHYRFSRAELDAAIAEMPRQASLNAEPTQLRRGKIERMKLGAAA